MSAQVTIQRTFTTTTTSTVLINVGYFKTLPGLLKVFQLIMGCIVVGIIGHYISSWNANSNTVGPEIFLLLTATTCLITTTLLLISCIFSIATASILPKTFFEILYHVVASILYVAAAGATLFDQLNKERRNRFYNYKEKNAAASIGLVNSVIYLISTLYSVAAYRRR